MKWEDFLGDGFHHNLYVSALVYMPTIKIIRRIARPGERILEAGCGSGRTSMLLADMGYRLTALDRSEVLLHRISPSTSFLPGLQFVQADMENLPFPDKTFKMVFSCGVLEHFDPPQIVDFLNEQKRVSTFVLVDVPNFRCVKRSFGDERFYTDEEWTQMFHEAGLKVIKLMHRGLDTGKFVGNCSVILAAGEQDVKLVQEEIDVYDYY
jgi:SAM-dependent methyltransferase